MGYSGRHASGASYISTVIQKLGVIDLKYVGDPFAWTNNREGVENIRERIGRAFVNIDWFSCFPDSVVFHLTRVASDHTPILLDTRPVTTHLRRPYRYFRGWKEHKEYKNFFDNTWSVVQVGADHDLLSSLKCLSTEFKDWNKNVFKNIFKNKEMLLKQIENENRKPGHSLSNFKLRELEEELETWNKTESIYWKENSRDKFLNEDDRCTKYFHARASQRNDITLFTL